MEEKLLIVERKTKSSPSSSTGRRSANALTPFMLFQLAELLKILPGGGRSPLLVIRERGTRPSPPATTSAPFQQYDPGTGRGLKAKSPFQDVLKTLQTFLPGDAMLTPCFWSRVRPGHDLRPANRRGKRQVEFLRPSWRIVYQHDGISASSTSPAWPMPKKFSLPAQLQCPQAKEMACPLCPFPRISSLPLL